MHIYAIAFRFHIHVARHPPARSKAPGVRCISPGRHLFQPALDLTHGDLHLVSTDPVFLGRFFGWPELIPVAAIPPARNCIPGFKIPGLNLAAAVAI